MSEALAQKNRDTGHEVPMGRREVLVDDDDTRVTRWTFAPGEGTGWHRHQWPYLVVPQSYGHLTLHRDGGDESVVTTIVAYAPGAATKWSDVPFEHYAVNTGTEPVRLLEIEFKRGA